MCLEGFCYMKWAGSCDATHFLTWCPPAVHVDGKESVTLDSVFKSLLTFPAI